MDTEVGTVEVAGFGRLSLLVVLLVAFSALEVEAYSVAISLWAEFGDSLDGVRFGLE